MSGNYEETPRSLVWQELCRLIDPASGVIQTWGVSYCGDDVIERHLCTASKKLILTLGSHGITAQIEGPGHLGPRLRTFPASLGESGQPVLTEESVNLWLSAKFWTI